MSDVVAASSRDAGLEPLGFRDAGSEESCIRFDRDLDPASRGAYSYLATFLGIMIVQAVAPKLAGWTPGGVIPLGDILTMLGYWACWGVLPGMVRRSVDRKETRKLGIEAAALRSQLASTQMAKEAERRELAAALAQTMRRRMRHSRQHDAGAELTRFLREFDLPLPRTLVHLKEEMEEVLRATPLVEDMLEPEFVDEERSQPSQRWWRGALILVLALLLLFGGIGIWSIVLFGALVGLTIAVRHCEFSRSAPFVRYSSHRWIAAPGCVQLWLSPETDSSATPALWAAGEAIMEIERPPMKTIQVRFHGERRSPVLAFASVKSPVFIALWQRWNHPHPRPELLDNRPAGQG